MQIRYISLVFSCRIISNRDVDMILLQINKLEKSFDGDIIFSDVDFEVKTGEE